MQDMEMMLHVNMAEEGIKDYQEGGPADIGRDYWDLILKDRMANWDALNLESRESKIERKKHSRFEENNFLFFCLTDRITIISRTRSILTT